MKWIEINIKVEARDIENLRKIVVDFLAQLAGDLKRVVDEPRSWHYLWESNPYPLTLRIRFYGKDKAIDNFKSLLEARIAEFRNRYPNIVGDSCYGRHGVCGETYDGEVDRYGVKGWEIVRKILEFGSETVFSASSESRGS